MQKRKLLLVFVSLDYKSRLEYLFACVFILEVRTKRPPMTFALSGRSSAHTTRHVPLRASPSIFFSLAVRKWGSNLRGSFVVRTLVMCVRNDPFFASVESEKGREAGSIEWNTLLRSVVLGSKLRGSKGGVRL
jgi:hypothetical protein